jgi:hypothetical protein
VNTRHSYKSTGRCPRRRRKVEGRVRIEHHGETLLDNNIWVLYYMGIVAGGFSPFVTGIKIFIDGQEVPKPPGMEDES